MSILGFSGWLARSFAIAISLEFQLLSGTFSLGFSGSLIFTFLSAVVERDAPDVLVDLILAECYLGAALVLVGVVTAVGDLVLASCKLEVTKTDMQIKPVINKMPAIGLSHITDVPK